MQVLEELLGKVTEGQKKALIVAGIVVAVVVIVSSVISGHRSITHRPSPTRSTVPSVGPSVRGKTTSKPTRTTTFTPIPTGIQKHGDSSIGN